MLVFLGTDCPVGNLYVPRLNELNREFRKQGRRHSRHQLQRPRDRRTTSPSTSRNAASNSRCLKDPENLVADSALVERTCEVIVLDGFARIRYRGAIDDQYVQGKGKDAPGPQLSARRPRRPCSAAEIAVPATKVAGCLIDRVELKPVEQANGSADPRGRSRGRQRAGGTRERASDRGGQGHRMPGEVAAIIQNKCQTCHRPGQVAPFSLLTYDDAEKHSAMIREVVDRSPHAPLARRSALWPFRQRSQPLAAGTARRFWPGSIRARRWATPRQLPPRATFPEGWTIGKPDVVFEIPETYYVPAQGVVSYVYFRVPTNFKEDIWVQAAEAVPGDRSVVHHIIVYVNRSQGRARPGGRPQPMHFSGYAPGDAPSVFPEGTAKRIPAGSDLMFQVHYTPIGKVKTDRSKVGLVFSKTKPTREAFTLGIANADLLLPAQRRRHRRRLVDGLAARRARLLELLAAHAPARQGFQVHDHQARRVARRSCSRCPRTISAGRRTTS